ncbi:hypothetical protein PWG14_08275 (plasmid) [Chromobacterium amazonense]|uniref:hypothetical protein n=1 Tax=Chromobacterium amazonense TaxID=1382803 RepID=UPI00237E7515|nr:hypothetical protein [Chromobacterium amazonense]MDE1712680.1 hypothetical protein [Chromobacterium amazonense]
MPLSYQAAVGEDLCNKAGKIAKHYPASSTPHTKIPASAMLAGTFDASAACRRQRYHKRSINLHSQCMNAEILDQQAFKKDFLLTPRQVETKNKTLLINNLLIFPEKKQVNMLHYNNFSPNKKTFPLNRREGLTLLSAIFD